MTGAAGSAFAVPAFRRLWVAGAVSDAGDWLLFIALPLLVLRLTGSAIGTSLAFLLEIGPPILLGPVAGRLADRLPRRPLLLVVALAQAAALAPLLLVRTALQLPLVYCVIVAQAALAAIFEPAKNALLPVLVGQERLLSANALVGLNSDLGRLVGGPVGGLLFGLAGLPVVVLADAATYLVAAALLASLPRAADAARGRDAPGKARGRSTRTAAARVLRRAAVRGPLLVLLVAAVAQGMFVVLFVFFVTGVLGGTDAEVGLLRGVQAVGAIAAGVALGTGRIRTGAARLAAIGTGAFALLSLAIWNVSFLTSATGVFVVLFAAVGAPGVLMATGLLTRLQAASTDADRGRVFAIAGVVQAVGQGCGLLLAGGLQGVVGTVPLLEVQGGLYVAAAVLAAVLLPRSAARTPAGDEVAAPGEPARGPGGTPAAARAGGSA